MVSDSSLKPRPPQPAKADCGSTLTLHSTIDLILSLVAALGWGSGKRKTSFYVQPLVSS